MSHCPDGTLFVGSFAHGLARLDTGGAITHPALPAGRRGVTALACDPIDGSVWIGFTGGGVARRRGDGSYEAVDATGAPAFARQLVQSIQVDRWSAGLRVLYFAFAAKDPATGALAGGGVASYDGP